MRAMENEYAGQGVSMWADMSECEIECAQMWAHETCFT